VDRLASFEATAAPCRALRAVTCCRAARHRWAAGEYRRASAGAEHLIQGIGSEIRFQAGREVGPLRMRTRRTSLKRRRPSRPHRPHPWTSRTAADASTKIRIVQGNSPRGQIDQTTLFTPSGRIQCLAQCSLGLQMQSQFVPATDGYGRTLGRVAPVMWPTKWTTASQIVMRRVCRRWCRASAKRYMHWDRSNLLVLVGYLAVSTFSSRLDAGVVRRCPAACTPRPQLT
jgi:hypothetical protein